MTQTGSLKLTGDEAMALRCRNLLLGGHEWNDPAAVATWMGAMQAQDLASAKWSFGLRLAPMSESALDEALAQATVLRTWPMRGTIHFVPARDAAWMLASTGRRALAGVQARWDYLGLNERVATAAAQTLDEALSGGRRLTRSAALETLTQAGIDTSGQRGYHLIWYAAQIGITCLGPNEGTEQTVQRLIDVAPDPVVRDYDDALREVALRYVRSHGPVTPADLARWSGLGVRAARAAITANEGALIPVSVDGTAMWMAASSGQAPAELPEMLCLPGFDEFVLGYKDRSLYLDQPYAGRIVPGNNGVFRSTIVLKGQIQGTWRRVRKTHEDLIDIEPFGPLTARQRKLVQTSFAGYSAYLERPVTVRWT